MGTDSDEKRISRRLFLRIMGWGSFFTALGITLIATIRFLFPRVLFELPSTFTIGFPDKITAGGEGDKEMFHVNETWKEERSVWIVRESNRLYALHSKCTHLGCTPNWFWEEGVFKCPCHGSRFDQRGKNYAGPAARPLDRFRIGLNSEGKIFVDKSRVYTYEEFNSPGSYLEI